MKPELRGAVAPGDITDSSGVDMAEEREVLDYAAAKTALDRLVGRRVSARLATNTGVTVAETGIGYLQPASQFGDYPRENEVTRYTITEHAEPVPGYHYPLWPDVRIHDVPDFKASTNGARVDCLFSGVTVTVELAISDDWLAAESAYHAQS